MKRFIRLVWTKIFNCIPKFFDILIRRFSYVHWWTFPSMGKKKDPRHREHFDRNFYVVTSPRLNSIKVNMDFFHNFRRKKEWLQRNLEKRVITTEFVKKSSYLQYNNDNNIRVMTTWKVSKYYITMNQITISTFPISSQYSWIIRKSCQCQVKAPISSLRTPSVPPRTWINRPKSEVGNAAEDGDTGTAVEFLQLARNQPESDWVGIPSHSSSCYCN